MQKRYTNREKSRYSRASRTRGERRLWPLWLIGFRTGRVVAGFCPDWASNWVVIEVDGGIHQSNKVVAMHDTVKNRAYRKHGYMVMRVKDDDCLHRRWRVLMYVMAIALPYTLGRWLWYGIRCALQAEYTR